MIAATFSILLFAIIGVVIKAPVLYWVIFGLYGVISIAEKLAHIGKHVETDEEIKFSNLLANEALKHKSEILDVNDRLIKIAEELLEEVDRHHE